MNRKRERQLAFASLEEASVKVFGGSYLRGNAKVKRPITTKKPMHLTMHSTLARGPYSLFKFGEAIERLVYKQARKAGVKIYQYANGGNHLHMVILPLSRAAFHKFVRAIAGLIARIVTGAQRGASRNLRFWSARPFTRIVEWGRDYKGVCEYLVQNTLEALGFIKYAPRKNRYGKIREAPA